MDTPDFPEFGCQSFRNSHAPSLQSCLLKLAVLGGYLNRASDGPPGNTVIWRGVTRLTDITIGYTLAQEVVGN